MFVLASQKGLVSLGFFGGPLETRTPDPLIKSQLLYQLRYRPTVEARLRSRMFGVSEGI